MVREGGRRKGEHLCFFYGKEKSYGFDYVLGLATESSVATQQPISKSVADLQLIFEIGC